MTSGFRRALGRGLVGSGVVVALSSLAACSSQDGGGDGGAGDGSADATGDGGGARSETGPSNEAATEGGADAPGDGSSAAPPLGDPGAGGGGCGLPSTPARAR